MRLLTPLFVMVLAAGSSVACSSTSPSSAPDGCASNPFSCPAGQTCSAKDTSGAFACLPSGSGKKGDACLNTPGSTTCGDKLVCLQLVQSGGSCTSFCEPGSATRACATGETCSAAGLQGTSTVFYVCAGGTKPADAGAGDAATD
jgi:hypothetical protein